MTGFMGRLQARLGLDTADFSRGLRGAQQQADGFGPRVAASMRRLTSTALGVTAIGTAAVGAGVAVRNFLRDVAAIGDQAAMAGVDAESWQEWAHVFEANRIPVELMTEAFKELNLRADEFAVTGGGSAADALRRLGFDAGDVARRLEDPSELLLEITERMQGLDTAGRIRVADELFGGAAGERFVQLINMGGDGIRELISEAHEFGNVLENEAITRATILERKFSELADRAGGFVQTMAVNVFMGGFETTTDALERMFGSIENARSILGDDWVERLTADVEEFAEEASEGVGDAAMAFAAVRNAVADARPELEYFARALRNANEIGAEQVLRDLITEADTLQERFAAGTISAGEYSDEAERLANRIKAIADQFEDMDGVSLSGLIGRINTLTEAVTRLGERAAEAREAMPGGRAPGMDQGVPLFDQDTPLMPQDYLGGRRASAPPPAPNEGHSAYDSLSSTGSGGGGSASPSGYAGAVADIRARTEALQAEAVALAEVAASGQDYGDAAEYAAVRAEMLAEAQAEGREITPELRAEIDGMAQAYVSAGQRVEDLTEALERQHEAGQRGASALTDVFMAAMDGADAGRAAIARLIMELARMQAMRAFQGLASSGGIFGSLLQVLGIGLGKNARGTESWRGGLSLVGEEGPELINLPTGAQVTPALETARLAREAARGGAGGRLHVSIGFDETTGGFKASVLSEAGAMMAQGFQQMNNALPGRVREINRNPRQR
ncbi:hypothetical protein JI664_03525 [Rhodobacter sp. NTK016B]|uniref:hypothetical protein n=1 Tax=Rhodobacter sp. NTK016B TaxID=2759676 RepID=UPI001A8F41FF|nr:hypothetical protein [Rhodobacter sp. NTK016B]MBN8291027.1 hypothetical protein [Rhodobacter sp. NTK016B]